MAFGAYSAQDAIAWSSSSGSEARAVLASRRASGAMPLLGNLLRPRPRSRPTEASLLQGCLLSTRTLSHNSDASPARSLRPHSLSHPLSDSLGEGESPRQEAADESLPASPCKQRTRALTLPHTHKKPRGRRDASPLPSLRMLGWPKRN